MLEKGVKGRNLIRKKLWGNTPNMQINFLSNLCLISELYIYKGDSKEPGKKTTAGSLKMLNRNFSCCLSHEGQRLKFESHKFRGA